MLVFSTRSCRRFGYRFAAAAEQSGHRARRSIVATVDGSLAEKLTF